MKSVALSFGNSRIAAAILDDTELLELRHVGVDQRQDWPHLAQWISRKGKGLPKAAVSVNLDISQAFLPYFPDPVLLVGYDCEIPIPNHTDMPEQTGHDRLVSGYAAATLYGLPLLVVDFGTAVTFNLIDSDGIFQGGAIAPGLALSASSLGKGCAQLPDLAIPLEIDIPLVGRDTRAAMLSGLVNGHRGMVESMVRGFKAVSGSGCTVVATGGGACLFVQDNPLFHHHDQDLLLKGVALIRASCSGRSI